MSSTDDDESENLSSSDHITLSRADIQNAINFTMKTVAAVENKNTTNNSMLKPNPRNLSNDLTEFIPGYVAPLSLDSSALDKYKQALSSQKTLTLPAPPSIPKNDWTKNFKHHKSSSALKSTTTAGEEWFGMEFNSEPSITKDIAIIRNRNYLDPKKFYKSSDFNKKGGKEHTGIVQLGTVIEGAMESIHSNRLTKKQRKATVMEEVMGEAFQTKDDYVKKSFGKLQRESSEAGTRRRHVKKRRKW